MRSGNPVLSDSTFLDLGSGAVLSRPTDAMTLNGTIAKTGFLLFLTLLTAAFAWSHSISPAGPTAARGPLRGSRPRARRSARAVAGDRRRPRRAAR